MRKTLPAAFLTIAIVALGCGGSAKSSAEGGDARSDVWVITVNAKSHTHVHGSSSTGNEEKLNDDDVSYTLSLTVHLHGTNDGGSIELGEDGSTVGTPTSSGTATERLHNRHLVMRDLQEQWVTRDGSLDPPPSGAGAHFAWDASTHQSIFEVTGHYSGTQSSREHVISVGNNVDRTDNSSEKWVQSAMFGGNAKHPVTVKKTKAGFTVDWAWTESTRDPSGVTRDVDQSGHADIHL
jgi:hypothetical protein